ncbi:MAG: mechanosensitive ion channel [Clostridia bacterium]|nr:mechanosensitive ion channel [Clostridia bacterium]
MNTFEEIKVLLRQKSGKKLAAISVAAFLIITALVFLATFKLCENIQLKLMDEYLWEVPEIIDSRRNELLVCGRVYEDDVLARVELGLKLYEEDKALSDAERLERVRAAASADSVSLLDGQGKLLSTTGPVTPEEVFNACVRNLEPLQAHWELYPAPAENGTETGKNDGRLFVRFPMAGNTEHSLVFEFSCGALLEMYNALDDWTDVLERMVSGGNVAAYAKTGDKLEEYTLDDLSDEEKARLYEELTKIFENGGSFRSTGEGNASKLITLLGRRYLAVLMHYPQEAQDDTDILLTLALKNVIRNGFYIAAAISAIIGLGIVLLLIYVFRRLLKGKPEKEGDKFSSKRAIRATWQGILVVFAVTVLFSCMLLLLESRTNVAFITKTKRMQLESEIDWRKSETSAIQSTFVDAYRTRAQMLADFLTAHPDYRTREGLSELSRMAKSDYLMIFDSAGKELVSSNSYTGFSVGANLSKDYQAVLMGYPYAVVGPAADPYTGAMQLGTAILMTDSAGQPDGFLLAVYSTGDLNARLKEISLENTVSSQAVREGYIAAAISNETGRFIAHTDPEMIGQKASDYIEDYESGSSFEGFADYNGESMCVSAHAADGKTILFMVPERGDSFARAIFSPLFLAALLILALLDYPASSLLMAKAMGEGKEKLQTHTWTRNPMRVFIDGYSAFLTLFALFALIASYNGWWTSFDYVFSGEWSHGVHLFSVWMALFILAVTFCCLLIVRTVLGHLESRLSLQGRTVTRLAHSLISYAACFFLIFYILSIFGVNTTALVASAGIISIAAGMGAQSMAADLLAGFFMMLEGTVHVGDYVDIAKIKGQVTDMGIRTITITDAAGNTVTINNSKATPICNLGREAVKPKPDSKQEKGSIGDSDDD